MSKTQSWNLELAGQSYQVSLKRNWAGKHQLTVNEIDIRLKAPSISQMLVGREEVISLGADSVILVMRGNKADLSTLANHINPLKAFQSGAGFSLL